jgi:hypothetical protein
MNKIKRQIRLRFSAHLVSPGNPVKLSSSPYVVD